MSPRVKPEQNPCPRCRAGVKPIGESVFVPWARHGAHGHEGISVCRHISPSGVERAYVHLGVHDKNGIFRWMVAKCGHRGNLNVHGKSNEGRVFYTNEPDVSILPSWARRYLGIEEGTIPRLVEVVRTRQTRKQKTDDNDFIVGKLLRELDAKVVDIRPLADPVADVPKPKAGQGRLLDVIDRVNDQSDRRLRLAFLLFEKGKITEDQFDLLTEER